MIEFDYSMDSTCFLVKEQIKTNRGVFSNKKILIAYNSPLQTEIKINSVNKYGTK